MMESLSPTSRALSLSFIDPGVPLRSTPGFMLSPRFAGLMQTLQPLDQSFGYVRALALSQSPSLPTFRQMPNTCATFQQLPRIRVPHSLAFTNRSIGFLRKGNVWIVLG